jgi:hypothetical protein
LLSDWKWEAIMHTRMLALVVSAAVLVGSGGASYAVDGNSAAKALAGGGNLLLSADLAMLTADGSGSGATPKIDVAFGAVGQPTVQFALMTPGAGINGPAPLIKDGEKGVAITVKPDGTVWAAYLVGGHDYLGRAATQLSYDKDHDEFTGLASNSWPVLLKLTTREGPKN